MSEPLHVLIAGGGVAALEATLALRALAEERVDIEVLAPDFDFVYRPMSVAEPFQQGEVERFPLARLAELAGARLTPGTLARVDLDNHRVETADGVPIVLADQGVDSAIVLFVPPVVAGADEVAAAVAPAGVDGKAVLTSLIAEGEIPPTPGLTNFPYPESAARALGLAAARAEWLRRPAGFVPPLDGVDTAGGRAVIAKALSAGDDLWLRPDQVRELLQAYGIPVVPERIAPTADEAAGAASELGFPAVVKSAEPGAHKTETGGIALGLETEDDVRDAAGRIGPPVLVQTMLEGSAELLAGVVQDPVFGPLVAFGPGVFSPS
jgi:acyl-CoA synthetase (NDP forming)